MFSLNLRSYKTKVDVFFIFFLSFSLTFVNLVSSQNTSEETNRIENILKKNIKEQLTILRREIKDYKNNGDKKALHLTTTDVLSEQNISFDVKSRIKEIRKNIREIILETVIRLEMGDDFQICQGQSYSPLSGQLYSPPATYDSEIWLP